MRQHCFIKNTSYTAIIENFDYNNFFLISYKLKKLKKQIYLFKNFIFFLLKHKIFITLSVQELDNKKSPGRENHDENLIS